MYILGISCYYHDASATLLKDGVVVAAAEEERFTRIKHDATFPINAINYCLKKANINASQIHTVTFYEKPFLKFERILSQTLEMFPLSLKTFLSAMPSWLNKKLRILSAIRKKVGYRGDVMFIEHHLSHAASAFFTSPFRESAILTIDGVGEWTTTAYGKGKEIDVELEKCIDFPHSLGLLYSTITAYLGFSVNNSEYKVMGLAAYGIADKKKNKYYKKLLKTIDIKPDGSFRLDLSYFSFHHKNRMPSKKLCKLLCGPINKRDTIIGQREKDIAAALQMITEEVIIKLLTHIYKTTKSENIVLAGGVALNSVCNGKILKKTPFKKIWIQPNASDGGASMGAALFTYHTILRKPRKKENRQISAYLGPSYTNKEIKRFLEKNKIKFTEFKTEKELLKTTARLLYKNKVIGWFQGGMEWGPRALGSRSILANPCNPKAKELLNKKVKHREKFRPFAPVVCKEDALTYFDCDIPIPEPTDYMLMVYPIHKKWHKVIPSVTHVDGTGRLQTITQNQNKLYYNIIREFGKLSKIPILINTSFNIRGEPIVCTPHDAYKCMMGTGIDYLAIGKFLVKRKDNKQDIWDSEIYAKD